MTHWYKPHYTLCFQRCLPRRPDASIGIQHLNGLREGHGDAYNNVETSGYRGQGWVICEIRFSVKTLCDTVWKPLFCAKSQSATYAIQIFRRTYDVTPNRGSIQKSTTETTQVHSDIVGWGPWHCHCCDFEEVARYMFFHVIDFRLLLAPNRRGDDVLKSTATLNINSGIPQ